MIDAVGIVVVFGVILVSMMLHELAHGGVAYLLGDTTAKDDGRLTLNPIKHLDPVMSIILPLFLYVMGAPVFGGAKPVPVDSTKLKGKEWGMAAVAIAGPLVNFLLALVSFLFMYFNNIGYSDGIIGMVLYEGLFVNLGFMVFNLFPIPPLDGSRVLYALAPDGVRELMKKLEGVVGIIVVYILIFFFGSVFYGLMTGAMNGILQFFYWIVGA
ncbi:site-2 protease family protein [Candidatus Saccharibacteria bacterium]|nr:site-2 protease family protein [Candidatus Saccharibacteria bacterium]